MVNGKIAWVIVALILGVKWTLPAPEAGGDTGYIANELTLIRVMRQRPGSGARLPSHYDGSSYTVQICTGDCRVY